MKEWMTKIATALWCHRAVYVGLAAAYGALSVGVDKDMVNMACTSFYAMLAMQRH